MKSAFQISGVLQLFLLSFVVPSGLIDSSGIKFTYTKTLRKYDAGIMELGLEYIDKMALPPALPLWKLVAYCIPECTKAVRLVSASTRRVYWSFSLRSLRTILI